MALSITSLEVKKRERCKAQPSSLEIILKRNEKRRVWLTLDLHGFAFLFFFDFGETKKFDFRLS